MRPAVFSLLIATTLSPLACKSLQASKVKEDAATKAIRESLPGGLVRIQVPKEDIIKYIIPADGSNGAPETMNGIWWTNARSVRFVVSFRNAVWHPDTHRATILMTGPFTYSTMSEKGSTDIDAVSGVPIGSSYSGYDIEYNAAGDFGNLLMASSDRNGNRQVRDAGYTMIYSQDGDWIRKTVGSDDYHIRRIYNADGTKNPIIYNMKVRQNGDMVDFTGTAFDGYMKDDGMGPYVDINLPANAISAKVDPASGQDSNALDLNVDPAAARTFIVLNDANAATRGVITVSDNFQGELYVQDRTGQWVSGKSTDLVPGGAVPATADGDGKAKSIYAEFNYRGLIALRSPNQSNDIIHVTFKPLASQLIDETAPIALTMAPGDPEAQVVAKLTAPTSGFYTFTTDATFPVNISAINASYYREAPVSWAAGPGNPSLRVAFSGSGPVTLKLTLPQGSPGGTFHLSLAPDAAPVLTSRGAVPGTGRAITGTLTGINGADVWDVSTFLDPAIRAYTIQPKVGPDQCCFDVVTLSPRVTDPLQALFGVSHRASVKEYLYMNPFTANRIAVVYTGPLNPPYQSLAYSFTLTPRPNNQLPDLNGAPPSHSTLPPSMPQRPVETE